MTIRINLNEDQLRLLVTLLENNADNTDIYDKYMPRSAVYDLLEQLTAIEDHMDDVYDMEAKRLIRGE